MSNRYFTNVPSFTAGTVARGDEVDDKFDAVTAGLDIVQSEVNDAIRLTNADITTEQTISGSAVTRANKVIGFDSSGNLTLLIGGANWKGDWTTATYYRKNEIIRDAGGAIALNSLFICTQEHTSSNLASDSGYWDIMVDVGEVEDWAHLEGSTVDGVEYSAKENAVGNAVATGSAKNWASKTAGVVAGGEYSAKEYAIGTTVATGSAKDWAQQLTTAVDGSGYSAKEWAIGSTVSSAYRWAELTGASVDGGGVAYSAKEWAVGTTVPGGSARDWAYQTVTAVDGSEYSAKEYAVGVDVPTGSAKEWATTTGAAVAGGEWSAKEWSIGSLPTGGSAKLWATKITGTVDGVDYSAREYATGTTVSTGSAKLWATKTGAVVSGDYSAKEWAIGTAVTSGSAKNWAMQTGSAVTGSDVSAKEWAIGTFIADGSAKDWATQAEDSLVNGVDYSAKHYAAKAAASAVAAAASYDSFDDRYLGPKASAPTLDNDGNALITGALYFDTTLGYMRTWSGSAWVEAFVDGGIYVAKSGSTMTGPLLLDADGVSNITIDNSNYPAVLFRTEASVNRGLVFADSVNLGCSLRAYAANGTDYKQLTVKQDGTFMWDGQSVYHAGNFPDLANTYLKLDGSNKMSAMLEVAYSTPRIMLRNGAAGAPVWLYQDGSSFYILKNNTAGATTWDTHRPFYVNMSTGVVTFATQGYSCAGTANQSGTFNLSNKLNCSYNGTSVFGPKAVSTANGTAGGVVQFMNNGGTGDANAAGIEFHCSGAYGIKFHLRPDGYIGWGGWSAASWRFYQNAGTGDVVAAGNITAYSDPRLKENLTEIDDPLGKIASLRGVAFQWKDMGDDNWAVPEPGKWDYGVLADEVEAVFPYAVSESIEIEGSKYKTVSYDKLVPALIEAVKILKAEVEQLKKPWWKRLMGL